ncbi:ATP-binding protein [Rhodobacter sp. KR11]|uniref:hybrid sensor histidine kinase/response regulator n=1 Tax=Rhodobacter sp. KR11 TaxID=2974588 RepID=UPI0022229FA6|nr:ATP-binding protein [Rhodobacter sp. KR11]MCW1920076.1 ATP-binding protein [Rhodobacter sp. KR11]
MGEIRHQYDVLSRFALRRRALVTLAFGLGLAYQPLWITLVFFALDVIFDFATLRLLRDLNPSETPGRYLWALVVNMGLSTSFTAFPALSWLVDAPLAKAYALALVLIALIHHSTLRNVHRPLSSSASLGTSVVALGVNTWAWARVGDWETLAVTTLSLGAAIYYALLTIEAMHRLQADLRHEREVAAHANKAKTRFVAQLSHELRTPLNAIIGLSEAERMTAPDAEAKARMAVLVQSARDLGDLLEDILDLSAIEAEALAIRPQTIDLHGQIRCAVQLFGRQFEDHGMQLDLDLAPDLPEKAWADGKRLRQCLSNMLSNAVKYGQSGQVRMEAGLAGNHLWIKVSDHGPGVPEALRERIFEPFVRGQELAPGTGLGLSISRMLARRMGGDLVLLPARTESGSDPQGEGAQFLLTLPYIQPPAEAPTVPHLRFDGLRVLVVDDIATNRLVAATYLRLLGAEALQAPDGQAARQMVREARPDVILMDLLMPGLSGAETRDLLAKDLGADLPPVIAVSAEAAPRGGFDGHLVKPLTLEKLREALTPCVAALQ